MASIGGICSPPQDLGAPETKPSEINATSCRLSNVKQCNLPLTRDQQSAHQVANPQHLSNEVHLPVPPDTSGSEQKSDDMMNFRWQIYTTEQVALAKQDGERPLESSPDQLYTVMQNESNPENFQLQDQVPTHMCSLPLNETYTQTWDQTHDQTHNLQHNQEQRQIYSRTEHQTHYNLYSQIPPQTAQKTSHQLHQQMQLSINREEQRVSEAGPSGGVNRQRPQFAAHEIIGQAPASVPFSSGEQIAQSQFLWPPIAARREHPDGVQAADYHVKQMDVVWVRRTLKEQEAKLRGLMEKFALYSVVATKKQWPNETQICKAIEPSLSFKLDVSTKCPYCSSENISYMEDVRRWDTFLQHQHRVKQRGEELTLETGNRCSECEKEWKVRPLQPSNSFLGRMTLIPNTDLFSWMLYHQIRLSCKVPCHEGSKGIIQVRPIFKE